MYGLSNGEHIFDLTWPLKVQGQSLKTLKSNISKTVWDREKVSIEVRKVEVRKLKNNTFIPVYIQIHIQKQNFRVEYLKNGTR